MKIGTKVIMSEVGKKAYLDRPRNPHKGFKTVVKVWGTLSKESYSIVVEWEKGRNSYRPEDLSFGALLNVNLKDYL